MNQNYKSRIPLIIVLSIVAGIYLGKNLNNTKLNGLPSFNFQNNSQQKLVKLLNYVDDYYVEQVDKDLLVDKAIAAITQELDPHSTYISAEDLQAYTDPLEGSFSGIGIEFMVFEDTVNVINVVKNGPSAKAGLTKGDKLLQADSIIIAGANLSNRDIIKTLKGPSNSAVKLKLLRGQDTLIKTITRGSIPIESVQELTVLDDLAYIKILRFSKNTDQEFFKQLDQAKKEGLNKIVIDLRNNGGGYLEAATEICSKLLDKGDLIVYTEGHARPRKEYRAQGSVKYQGMQFAILINNNSASASEIMAGAFQDNDKAQILGERSFGKGLVQEQLKLPGESAVRLTVAKYYTPSGRCIQKPYINQKGEHLSELDYTFQDLDSLPQDTTPFYTKNGRVVYGGGGIVPDIAINQYQKFNEGASGWFSENYRSGKLQALTFKYALQSPWTEFEDFDTAFDVDQHFSPFLKKQMPELDTNNLFTADVKQYISFFIARHLFSDNQSELILLRDDSTTQYLLNHQELWP